MSPGLSASVLPQQRLPDRGAGDTRGERGRGPHQDELAVRQLAGPVGFGAVTLQQSLCAVDLVLILPSGQTLRAGKASATLITTVAAGARTTMCAENCYATEPHMVPIQGPGHGFMGRVYTWHYTHSARPPEQPALGQAPGTQFRACNDPFTDYLSSNLGFKGKNLPIRAAQFYSG